MPLLASFYFIFLLLSHWRIRTSAISIGLRGHTIWVLHFSTWHHGHRVHGVIVDILWIWVLAVELVIVLGIVLVVMIIIVLGKIPVVVLLVSVVPGWNLFLELLMRRCRSQIIVAMSKSA